MSRRNGHDHAARPELSIPVPLIGQGAKQPAPLAMHVSPAAFEADAEPSGDLVLLRMLKPGKTAGGLELPDGASDGRPRRAQVVKVGPGLPNHRANDGSTYRMDKRLKPGVVVYPNFNGPVMQFHIGDEEYRIVGAGQITLFSKAAPEPLPA